MSRLSLRWRLTLAFALAMAVLLAATGAFLYVRQRSTLDEQIEKSLRARADDVTVLVRSGSRLSEGGRLVEPEESFAQVVGPSGAVVDSTPPLGRTPLLTRAQLAGRARGRSSSSGVRSPGSRTGGSGCSRRPPAPRSSSRERRSTTATRRSAASSRSC